MKRWNGRCRERWRAWSSAAFRSTAPCCHGCPANSAPSRPRLQGEIDKIAGQPVNVGRPKQLGDILFGQMNLPGGSKTKTGQWSTAARELEELAEQGHELPRKIIDWRQVSKLRSTYTEALPNYVHPRHAARPHVLFARRDLDRPAVIVRAEPAEHPDPHRGRPQDPQGLRRRARHETGVGRLLADRIAPARPKSPTCRHCARRSRTASTFTP